MKTPTIQLAFSAALLAGVGIAGPRVAIAQPTAKSPPLKSGAGPSAGAGSQQEFNMVVQSRGRLGARVITMSPDLRKYFGAPEDAGLLVDTVVPDSPAARAGLQTGDVITSVKGQSISEAWDIFQALSGAKKGDSAKIEIIRDKKKRTLSATLDDDGSAPFGMQGGMQGMGTAPFHFELPFGRSFPFGKDLQDKMSPGMPSPFGTSPWSERIRELEERIEQLEGTEKPGKKGKQLKIQPGATGKKS